MSIDDIFEFPCEFPIKAIGDSHECLYQIIFDLVKTHIPDLDDKALVQKTSKNGNYQSITITIIATSRKQLDAIYQDLTACEYIKMVF
ncbi:MAG: YbeD family protein [Gammaproteobacteria bacterium]